MRWRWDQRIGAPEVSRAKRWRRVSVTPIDRVGTGQVGQPALHEAAPVVDLIRVPVRGRVPPGGVHVRRGLHVRRHGRRRLRRHRVAVEPPLDRPQQVRVLVQAQQHLLDRLALDGRDRPQPHDE